MPDEEIDDPSRSLPPQRDPLPVTVNQACISKKGLEPLKNRIQGAAPGLAGPRREVDQVAGRLYRILGFVPLAIILLRERQPPLEGLFEGEISLLRAGSQDSHLTARDTPDRIGQRGCFGDNQL